MVRVVGDAKQCGTSDSDERNINNGKGVRMEACFHDGNCTGEHYFGVGLCLLLRTYLLCFHVVLHGIQVAHKQSSSNFDVRHNS